MSPWSATMSSYRGVHDVAHETTGRARVDEPVAVEFLVGDLFRPPR